MQDMSTIDGPCRPTGEPVARRPPAAVSSARLADDTAWQRRRPASQRRPVPDRLGVLPARSPRGRLSWQEGMLADEPVLRVVRGTPTAEELAALVGVLFTRRAAAVPATRPTPS